MSIFSMTDAEFLKQVQIFQDCLVASATGGAFGDGSYEELRKLIVANPRIKKLVPEFLKTNRTEAQFWSFIKARFAHYAERRTFIWNEFAPLIDELEENNHAPTDEHVSDVLSEFDSDNVHAVWQKALDRRRDDPEGAITSARTLLECPPSDPAETLCLLNAEDLTVYKIIYSGLLAGWKMLGSD
jgi:hypothetical protein